MPPQCAEYIHADLDQPIKAIAGHYRFTEELRLCFEGAAILFLKGYGVFDTSCCGASGCSFALVQGAISRWKAKKDAMGRFVSTVTSIVDAALRLAFTGILSSSFTCSKSIFDRSLHAAPIAARSFSDHRPMQSYHKTRAGWF